MSSLSQYWTLMRLTLSGQVQPQEIPRAKALVEQLRAGAKDEPVGDRALQKQLLQQDPEIAQLCFRCYVSHQILSTCNHLVRQFGQYYGFTRADLLPYLLDDDGQERPSAVGSEPSSDAYLPLSFKVLEKFDPEKSSLKTWARRLIDHSDALSHCLNQYGLWRISDWGILNQAKATSTRRILAEFHGLSSVEIEQSVSLLESYRNVYLSDRLLNGQTGQLCQPPTEAQLQRMSDWLKQHSELSWTVEQIDCGLNHLAARLRQHGVYRKSRRLPSQSVELGVLEQQSAQLDEAPDDLEQQRQAELLETYRTALSTCLMDAIGAAVGQRLKRLKAAKRKTYIEALRLFHSTDMTMGKIAPQVGLKTQVQVSRLLVLKALRADVRHEAIVRLKTIIRAKAETLVDPDWLEQVSNTIDQVLAEQVDQLLEEDSKKAQVSRSEAKQTYFAQSVCAVLNQPPYA